MDRILGVAIGIATLCLILSILASHLQEVWASYSARRAASLEIALRNMLGDPNLSEAFFDHPLIQNISLSTTRSWLLRGSAPTQPRPTYISSDMFSKVLQSVLVVTHSLTTKDLPNIIAAMPDSALKVRLPYIHPAVECA